MDERRPPRRFRLAAAGMAVLAGVLTACTSAQTVQGITPSSDAAGTSSVASSGTSASGSTATSASGSAATSAPAPAATSAPLPTGPVSSNARWPSSIANRKILDQHGDVYLMRSFASWAMAMNLTDDEIAEALEGVASRGFNAVTVWAGGGYDLGQGWHRYTTTGHGDWWQGQPWASDFGSGWASMDRVMQEALRLGLTVNFSFCGGNGSTGARPDWEKATDQDMYKVGVAVASRYRDYPNIVWHVMFDDSEGAYDRVNALFQGINDTEGAHTRPVRWSEPNNRSSIYSQLIAPKVTPQFAPTLNGYYNNWASGSGDSSTELIQASWNEKGATTLPTGDVEQAYDSSPYIHGDLGQQLRERSYADFLEGGVFINYSHEDWWPFGAQGWVDSTEDLTWKQVPDHVHTLQQQYLFELLDEYVAVPTWLPDDGSFLAQGTGSGGTKAAAGRSDKTAIAYFPSERDVVVNTTAIGGTDPVRLRWYDPTTGTYTTIAASEAKQQNRSVTYPAKHPDGTSDWVLVVDPAT
jgi:Putative collagen-binding domain of a collagenase/Protein of unknown function (DUF4038)